METYRGVVLPCLFVNHSEDGLVLVSSENAQILAFLL